jgi:hypothetical protein
MKEHWNVSLNVNTSFVNGYKIIGKNVLYTGNEETLYKSGNITVIGNAKIYNEPRLWKIIEINMPKPEHSLHILVELYRKFGYEDMLDLLEGDFSFLLLDYNIYGEESWLYVARDPFGIFPFYSYENPNHESKKVQFELETKQFGFSSTEYVDNNIYQSFIAGSYQRFSHSFKVSAVWKHNYRPRTFFKLPFFSIYEEDHVKEENKVKKTDITNAILKRMEWIDYHDMSTVKIGVLCLNPKRTNDAYFEIFHDTIRDYIEGNVKFEYVPIIPEMIQNEDNSSVFEWSNFTNDNDTTFVLQIEYIEKEYPTIITRLKQLLNSNDPSIIRSHFIPIIFAKYLSEKMPEVNHVFLAEPFTYNWIDKNYLQRRKQISQLYLDQNMKGWTQIFLVYGIHLYMPFLDRVLIQKITPSSIV